MYFLILFMLAKTGADAFGLIAISSAIGAFFAYLPNIVAALLLVILGTSLGQFAGEMVAQSARNSGIDFAPSLGKLVSGLIIFVVCMMAVAQLKIDTEIVRIVTSSFWAGPRWLSGFPSGLEHAMSSATFRPASMRANFCMSATGWRFRVNGAY